MKMLLMTTSYSPESSPPQRRWDAFVEAFVNAGWEVDVVAPVPHPKRMPARQGPMEKVPSWRRQRGRHGEAIYRFPLLRHSERRSSKLLSSLLGSILMIPTALATRRPDIVVTTVPALPNALSGYLISRFWRRPLIVDMRDAWPDLASDAGVAPAWMRAIMRRVVTGVQRRADLVVTVTEGFREVLQRRGCPRVETVPNGVLPARLPVLRRSPSGERKLHVLYMGNHGESQGLVRILDAARLAADYAEIRFAGSGTLKSELMQYAARTDSPVKFLPPTHGIGAVRLYEWADTCVVTLRPDWKSFDWTVPSKTYELLGIDRHVTGIVRGEAARILESCGWTDVVAANPHAIAQLWKELHENPARFIVPTSPGRQLPESMNFSHQGQRYVGLATKVAARRKHRGADAARSVT